MKKSILLVTAVSAALLASTALAPAKGDAAQARSASKNYSRHYSIPAMGIYNMPIAYDLSMGPVWDGYTPYRPGDGMAMLLDCHDVTPVPGYGEHGPCYNMPDLKKGDLVILSWKRVLYTYKVAINPRARWQCYAKTLEKEKELSQDPRRYRSGKWHGYCPQGPNNTFVKNGAVERIYFRCCWPRHTDWKYHYFYAELIHRRKIR